MVFCRQRHLPFHYRASHSFATLAVSVLSFLHVSFNWPFVVGARRLSRFLWLQAVIDHMARLFFKYVDFMKYVFSRSRLPSIASSLSNRLRSLFSCSASSMASGVGRVFPAAVNCTVPFSQLIVQLRLYDAFEVVLAPGSWAAPRHQFEDYLFCDSVVYVGVRCGRLWLGPPGCF